MRQRADLVPGNGREGNRQRAQKEQRQTPNVPLPAREPVAIQGDRRRFGRVSSTRLGRVDHQVLVGRRLLNGGGPEDALPENYGVSRATGATRAREAYSEVVNRDLTEPGRVARASSEERNWGAPHVGFTCGGFRSRCSQSLSADGIDFDQPGLSLRIERPTAPRPILRMLYQLSCNRIRMHVVELLTNFLTTPHIEIIESGLPETWETPVAFCKREAQLPCWDAAPIFSEIPRDALLQHFQDKGWRGLVGFADEQMHVIGHNHISDQRDFVAFTNIRKRPNEDVARPHRVE